MATVVLSDRLVNDILHKVKMLYKNRLDEANKVPQHWFEMVYNKLMPSTLVSKMEGLPATYFATAGGFNVKIPNHATYVAVIGPLGEERIVPREYDAETNGVSNCYSSYIIPNIDDPRWAEFLAEAKVWSDNIVLVEAERNTSIDNMRTLLSKSRTLGPVLKAYPPLWSLLDDETKRRHQEKVEPKKRAAVEAEGLVLDGLSVALMKDRLNNASKRE